MATYGSSSSAASQTGPANISKPTSTADGSYLVAFQNVDVAVDPSTLTLTGGTTWNEATSGEFNGTTYKVYWKLAGSSEPASNYSFDWDDSTEGYSTCHIIRATDHGTTAPTVQVTTTASSGTTVATPGITPPDATALEVRAALAYATGGGGITWSAPGGLTERTDTQTGGFVTGTTATRTLASGSATTSLNFTASGSVQGRVGITVGIPSVSTAQEVTLTGIASGEAFGTGQLNMQIPLTGIASAEAFGVGQLNMRIPLTGIASAEAFGGTVLIYDQEIGLTGIPSGEEFGEPSVRFPTQTLTLVGITSGEAFGLPALANLSQWVLVPPSVQETPAADDWLHARYGIHRGISIIKRQDGTFYQTRYPAQTELEEASAFWMGGRRHPLTPEEAQELIDAGYQIYMVLEEIDV